MSIARPINADDSDHYEPDYYILVSGLPRLSDPVQLVQGLTIFPIHEQLSVFDLAALGAVGFRKWAMLEPFIGQCNNEVKSSSEHGSGSLFDTPNRAWLAIALLVVRGYGYAQGLAMNTYSWRDVPIPGTSSTRKDLPRFRGNLLDLHVSIMAVKEPPSEPFETSVEWLATVYPVADRLCRESPGFLLALTAANDWRFSQDIRSAIARIWCGIEAVFGVSQELTYRIATVGSSILEPRGSRRIERYQEIKHVYSLRSKAVHGSKMSHEKLAVAIDESQAFLVELLIHVLDRGAMYSDKDFELAVLG
ncbi:MAG: hypothetical protein AAF297_04705 [Planctomycetota bacterium]